MGAKLYGIFLFVWISFGANGQHAGIGPEYGSVEDRAVFTDFLQVMEAKKSLPVGDLMVETARFFLNRPYVAATLEKEPEGLVVNLREFDCTTLVETTLALVLSVKDPEPSFGVFCEYLRQVRYRNGVINDYTDRLHYSTDWIYENQRKGWVKDVNREIGGRPLAIDLSFMSTHPAAYKQVKDHPQYVSILAAKEKEINRRSYYYLPETEIEEHASGIENGDIVFFVTTIKGLDVSHMGIICRMGGKLTFIHASTAAGKVIVNKTPLQEYVQSIKRNCGVIIVRPQARY